MRDPMGTSCVLGLDLSFGLDRLDSSLDMLELWTEDFAQLSRSVLQRSWRQQDFWDENRK